MPSGGRQLRKAIFYREIAAVHSDGRMVEKCFIEECHVNTESHRSLTLRGAGCGKAARPVLKRGLSRKGQVYSNVTIHGVVEYKNPIYGSYNVFQEPWSIARSS